MIFYKVLYLISTAFKTIFKSRKTPFPNNLKGVHIYFSMISFYVEVIALGFQMIVFPLSTMFGNALSPDRMYLHVQSYIARETQN